MSEKPNTLLVLLATAAQIAVVGWLDYATGYEISLEILYYVPIAFVAWRLGGFAAFVTATGCAAVWFVAGIASGHVVSHAWIGWENLGMTLLAFGFVAFSFTTFRRTLVARQERIRQLEEGRLTFCSCCQRVRDPAGQWSDLQTYLQENTSLETQVRLCPQCARARQFGEEKRKS